MDLELALLPVGVLVVGAVVSLAWPARATPVGAGAAIVACFAGFVGSLWHLHLGVREVWVPLPWRMPLGTFVVGIDPLSAFFAVPVFGLGGLGAIYGASYLRRYEGRRSLGAAWFAYDLLIAGMALLLLARNGLLFLVAWEAMSLAAWGLVSFEHQQPEVRRAGLVYLVATHAGSAALLVLFLLLLGASGGSPDFTDLRGAAPPAAVLPLAIVGFGAKMGLIPFHVWLPEAHAAAPAHVSALMSGVLVKMGVYGLIRTVVTVGGPPAWLGPLLLIVGFVGAFVGIGLALSQRDLKRVLACSTIENVGLVTIGLGLGFVGAASGHRAIAVIGLSAALLHVWNHAAMKGLLFLGAGSVVHGTGTRDLEALGGLLRRMPHTALGMVLGATAISALPPLNGFAGEWLLCVGLLEGGQQLGGNAGLGLSMGLGGLAFVGALAAASFARLVGIALLGEPRSAGAAEAHESPVGMLLPMAVLGAVCVGIGCAPGLVLTLADPLVRDLAGSPDTASAAGIVAPVGWAAVGLWCAVGIGAIGVRRAVAGARSAGTWDCGQAAPVPRAQYTGRAFARLAADHLLPEVLRPPVASPTFDAVFPGPTRLDVDHGDPLLDRAYLPALRAWTARMAALRRLQHGRTHLYVAYIGVAVGLALAWATWMGP